MLLDVSVLSPEKVIFEGKARSVTLPGEDGVFEVLPFHNRLISRLVAGTLFIDGAAISVARGIASAAPDKVTIIAETK